MIGARQANIFLAGLATYKVLFLIDKIGSMLFKSLVLLILLLPLRVLPQTDSLWYYSHDANIADSLKDYKRVINDNRRLIILVPDDYDAYYNLGLAESRIGEYDYARHHYNTIIKSSSRSRLGYMGLGYLNKDLKRYRESIRDFDTLIMMDTSKYVDANKFMAYYLRGIDKDKIDREEGALIDFDSVVKLNPKFGTAYYARGVVKSHMGKDAEAIKDFNKALKLQPDSGIIYCDRGVSFGKIGKLTEAMLDLNKAVKYFPNSYKVYCNRGIAESMLNKQNEAIADYDKAIELNPKEPDSYYNRALAYTKLTKNNNALADFQTAQSLYSDIKDTAMVHQVERDIKVLKKVMDNK